MTGVKREGTALIIVDTQNFMLDEKGLMSTMGVWKYAKEIKMVENSKKAIEKIRRANIPIIYIKMDIRPQKFPINVIFPMLGEVTTAEKLEIT